KPFARHEKKRAACSLPAYSQFVGTGRHGSRRGPLVPKFMSHLGGPSMIKFTVAGLAVCWACTGAWAQGSGGATIGVPMPGAMRRPGYNAPGVVMPGFVPAPPPGIVVLAPAHTSHYNPRIDHPPFTMVPNFAAFEPRTMPPVTGGTVTRAKE